MCFRRWAAAQAEQSDDRQGPNRASRPLIEVERGISTPTIEAELEKVKAVMIDQSIERVG